MFLFIVTEFKLLSVVYLFVKSLGGGKLQSQLEDTSQLYELVTLHYFMHVFDCNGLSFTDDCNE